MAENERQVLTLDLEGNILEQLDALEKEFEALDKTQEGAAKTFEQYRAQMTDFEDVVKGVKIDDLNNQIKTLDKLQKAGVISTLEHADALNEIRGRVDDVTDKFKAMGVRGEALANKLEDISDPMQKLALAQRLWNAQSSAGVKAVGALNAKISAADAEIFALSGGMLDLNKVTDLAAKAWLGMAAAAGVAGGVLIKVGKDAIMQAAEDNIYLRKQLEALEYQWETTQTKLGQTLLGGDSAVGGFDLPTQALDAFNNALEQNDVYFRALLPTILDVGETLVAIFSVTAPAAITPLLLLIDSIKFALTGVAAGIGEAVGTLADLALQLGVIDAEQAKTFRNFRDSTREAFDTVGLDSWTVKVWEAGGAVRDLAGELKGAAGESQRLVTSFDKLYILLNKDVTRAAIDDYAKATEEFIALGMGRSQAEQQALNALPAAQRKVIDEMMKTQDDFDKGIRDAAKDKKKANKESEAEDSESILEWNAKQLGYKRDLEERLLMAEKHYAKLKLAEDEKTRQLEESGYTDRLKTAKERSKELVSEVMAFSGKLAEAKLSPTLSDTDIEKLKADYMGLFTEIYTLYEIGGADIQARLEGLVGQLIEIQDAMHGIKSASPWEAVGAQMADAAKNGMGSLVTGAAELAGALAGGQGRAKDFGKFLKSEFISIGKTLVPILFNAGIGVEASRIADGVGMVGAAVALSGALGILGALGGGGGKKRQTQTASYDFGAVQDRFNKSSENEKAPKLTVYVTLGTDEIEAPLARIVQDGQTRGLYGRRV